MALIPKTNSIYEDYFVSNDVLGKGISGEILRCIKKTTLKQYALKALPESNKAKREIDIHWRACQNSPYIVQIEDVYENTIQSKRAILLVMELMEGSELFYQIKKRKFTEQEISKIMFQICSAVKHLHSMGIAHRDLKLENILLAYQDNISLIKITDFGFAKEVSLGLKTPCFTPYYVAPEILSHINYDNACDIWSLGVIMYILCCGQPPFYSENNQNLSPGMKTRIKTASYTYPEHLWSNISNESKELINGMLEPNADKRLKIDDILNSCWISEFNYSNLKARNSINYFKYIQILKQYQEVPKKKFALELSKTLNEEVNELPKKQFEEVPKKPQDNLMIKNIKFLNSQLKLNKIPSVKNLKPDEENIQNKVINALSIEPASERLETTLRLSSSMTNSRMVD